nr:SH3 domain-containing protein [uncultured Roseococcus sp.]
MRLNAALAVALLALVACREERGSAAEAREKAAREASAAAVLERLQVAGVRQRGVQVFPQALADTLAVCGRAQASTAAGSPFLPYVAIVSFEGATPSLTDFVLGASGREASRAFAQMINRCYEGGGPATRPTPAPELGDDVVAQAQAPAETPRGRGTVIVARSGAYLRNGTRGGAVIRSLPPSSTLQVVGEAPGGWYQVGQGGSPVGWVHSSVLQGPPTR